MSKISSTLKDIKVNDLVYRYDSGISTAKTEDIKVNDLVYRYDSEISTPKSDFIDGTPKPKIIGPSADKKMVQHPDHYDMEDKTYEPYKVINAWKVNFNIGNAIKYLARYKKKWNPIEDLEKAKQYIDFEIECLKSGSDVFDVINNRLNETTKNIN